ncbi:FixH family protein [Massilia sp. 9096]|uniref:FixH family protein n=1 Tax=Massilia sp. 9096 TaxID=1500894 RepID=UPI001EFBAC7C|nr:FixH family protein [Massilia sp. 9096]
MHARYLPARGRLEGRIDSFGYPSVAPFTIRLAHPTLPERDILLHVQADADGNFSVALPALEKTHWQVAVEGSQHDWRLRRRWDWGRQPELVIKADANLTGSGRFDSVLTGSACTPARRRQAPSGAPGRAASLRACRPGSSPAS